MSGEMLFLMNSLVVAVVVIVDQPCKQAPDTYLIVIYRRAKTTVPTRQSLNRSGVYDRVRSTLGMDLVDPLPKLHGKKAYTW